MVENKEFWVAEHERIYNTSFLTGCSCQNCERKRVKAGAKAFTTSVEDFQSHLKTPSWRVFFNEGNEGI